MWELLEKSYPSCMCCVAGTRHLPLSPFWHMNLYLFSQPTSCMALLSMMLTPTSQSFLANKFLLGILFATNIIHSSIFNPYTVTIRVGTVRFIIVPVSSYYSRQGLSRSPLVGTLYQLICQANPEISIGKGCDLSCL